MHSKQKLADYESGSNVPVLDLIQDLFRIMECHILEKNLGIDRNSYKVLLLWWFNY